MTRIALKILFGNPGKYLSMVLGVAFASLLICQQALIFCGLMRMAASQIQDTGGAEIWVMDPNAQFIDDNLPMRDRELSRVRGVDGVRWAVRIDKGQSRAKLMRAGEFQQLIVLGLNDTTLVGGPQDVSGLQGACSQVWPRRWASVCSDVVAPAAREKSKMGDVSRRVAASVLIFADPRFGGKLPRRSRGSSICNAVNSIEHNLATAVEYHKAGDLERAESLYRDVVRIDPLHADALHLLGVAAHQKKQHQTAIELIQRAVAVNRSAPSYHCNLGAAYRDLGRFDEARDSFCEALRLDPDFAGAHYNLAMTLESVGNRDGAITHYREATRLNPQFADAFNNLGNALASLHRSDEAIACFQQAIRIRPDFANAHFNLGNALQSCDRHSEAVASFRESIRLNSHVPEVHNNLGLALKANAKYDEAAVCLENAIRLKSNYAAAFSNLGLVRRAQQRWDQAIASFQSAAKLAPEIADLHYNLATALQHQKRFDEAIACFQRALAVDPNLAGAHYNLALIYEATGDLTLATEHFEKSLAAKPSKLGRLQLMTMLPPVYQSLDELIQSRRQLNANIDSLLAENFTIDAAESPSSTCFFVAYQGCENRPLLEKFNKLFRSSHVPACDVNKASNRADGRLRIGFVSSHFRNHTIGRLMRGVIARLSRSDFHVTVFSKETHRDEIGESIRDHADDSVELTSEIPVGRQRIVEQDVDVLFYADLGMDPVTYSLAQCRLAPVQCVTWGHPETTGMQSIDYFLSSDLAELETAQNYYTERLIRLKTLPTYYYRPKLQKPFKSRRDFGLPQQSAIYLCPQTLFKIHPEFDGVLAEILRRDPNGHIVFIDGMYKNWTTLLRRRFEKTIPSGANRVLFLKGQTYHDFHNLISHSEVLLDPIHFGGGNTNYEAMAFGVPVVTLPSPYLRGRVACALYRKMNVLDCVARNSEEYVDLAALSFAASWEGLETRLMIEVPCIDHVFEIGRTVDFFYEHNSHFTTDSLERMLRRCAGSVERIETSYNGEVIFGIAAFQDQAEKSAIARSALEFRDRSLAFSRNVRSQLDELHASGKRVAIWGGTGKAAAFINQAGLDCKRFPIVVDSDHDKVGTFVPGTGQEILSRDTLLAHPVDVILIATQWRALDIVLEIERVGISYDTILLEFQGNLIDYFVDEHPYRPGAAFLCGDDPLTGKSFEHRRAWIRQRLEFLASVFGIDCLTYAVMHNHLHVVLRSRPDVVAAWSEEEVARRWLRLFPPRREDDGSPAEPTDAELLTILGNAEVLAERRKRLSDVSWWMRCTAEVIARRANKEDRCTGRFWEGRYKAQVLLDEASLLACAAYVDLNPIRAALAKTPETSDFTGAKDRLDDLAERQASSSAETHAWERSRRRKRSGWLCPVEIDGRSDDAGPDICPSGRRASRKGFLSCSLGEYLALLDWTGRQLHRGKRRAIPAQLSPILERIGLTGDGWCELVKKFSQTFKRAAGTTASLESEAHRRGQTWLQAPGNPLTA
eukprot:g26652.t1